MRVGGVVPLVYDPLRPDRVALKSTVDANRLRKHPPWVPVLVLMILFLGVPLALLISYIVFIYLRERRLLRGGKLARATIVGESEYVYRSLSRSDATYTFQDHRGAVWTGLSKGSVWRNPDDPRPDPDLIEVPTAVYDPRNSARHMLYPGSFWSLAE